MHLTQPGTHLEANNNGWKLKPNKCKLEIKHRWLAVRVINKLPREVGDLPSVGIVQPDLDAFLEEMLSQTQGIGHNAGVSE